MERVVATIGKAHGLRGEVALIVRTDVPDERFIAGAAFTTDPASAGPLTIASVRRAAGRWLVAFEGRADRTAAEDLRGVELVIDAPTSDEAEAWYESELIGLAAVTPAGVELGEVVGLEYYPAQDVLVVREPAGERVLVPFVTAIVTEVDIPGGRVIIDPPVGMFGGAEEVDPADPDPSDPHTAGQGQ